MDVIQINVEPRTQLGKNGAKATRTAGRIPGVLYSKSNEVTHFSTTHSEVKSMIFTPEFKLAEISIDGKAHKALLKDVVFHPVTDEIQHLDFLELIDGHPLKAEIPVKVKGTSPGVKNGGKLIRTLRTVGVKSTPENLVDNLFVDISELELGMAVRVRDIEVPDGLTILVDGAIPVANVEVPRVLKTEEEEEQEGVEGEGEEGADEAATDE